jgi:hypothetical protein
VIDILADFIQEWNTKMIYKERPKNTKKEGNCQDFVFHLMEKLGIGTTNVFQGALGRFLKTVRQQGNSEMEFIPDETFCDKFPKIMKTYERSIIFKTHEELDVFVNALLEVQVDFEVNHKSEWLLLKSFDRAFWLREYKFRDDQLRIQRRQKDQDSKSQTVESKWIPLLVDSLEDGQFVKTCGCPFKDPQVTHTWVK